MPKRTGLGENLPSPVSVNMPRDAGRPGIRADLGESAHLCYYGQGALVQMHFGTLGIGGP